MKLGEILFQGISDFWLRFFSDRGLLGDLYEASISQVAEAYQTLITSLVDLSLEDTPVSKRVAWKAVIIEEPRVLRVFPDLATPEEQVAVGGYLAMVPYGINEFSLLCNTPLSPTRALEVDYDFEIIDNDTRRLLELQALNPNVPLSGRYIFFKGVSPFDHAERLGPTGEVIEAEPFTVSSEVREYALTVEDYDSEFNFFVDPSTSLARELTPGVTKIRLVTRGGNAWISEPRYISAREHKLHTEDEEYNRLHFFVGSFPPAGEELLYYSVGDNAPLYNDIVDDRTGKIVTGVYPARFLVAWANEVGVDSKSMYHNFGTPFSTSLVTSSEKYREYLRGLWYAYVTSMTPARLESVCNILAGYAVIRVGTYGTANETIESIEFPEGVAGTTKIRSTEDQLYEYPQDIPIKGEVVFSAGSINGRARDGRKGLWYDTTISGYKDAGVARGDYLVRVDASSDILDIKTVFFAYDTFVLLESTSDYEDLRDSPDIVNFSWVLYKAGVAAEPSFVVGTRVSETPQLVHYSVLYGQGGNVNDNTATAYAPEQFSALTSAFIIEDETTSPGWWKDIGIVPANLAEGVSRRRRQVTDQYFPNALGNPSHSHIGDIGAIVGRNDDETTPDFFTSTGRIFTEYVVADHTWVPMLFTPPAQPQMTQLLPRAQFPYTELAREGEVDFAASGVLPGDFLVVSWVDFPATDLDISGWNAAVGSLRNVLFETDQWKVNLAATGVDVVGWDTERMYSEYLLKLVALVPIVEVSKTALRLGAPLPWTLDNVATTLEPLVGQELATTAVYLAGQTISPVDRVVVLRPLKATAAGFSKDQAHAFRDGSGGEALFDTYKVGDLFSWELFSTDWSVVHPVSPWSTVTKGSLQSSPGIRRDFAHLLFDRIFKRHLFSVSYDASNQEIQASWDFISGVIEAAKPLHTTTYLEPSQSFRDIVKSQVDISSVEITGHKYDLLVGVDPTAQVSARAMQFFTPRDLASPGSAAEVADVASLAAVFAGNSLLRTPSGASPASIVLRGIKRLSSGAVIDVDMVYPIALASVSSNYVDPEHDGTYALGGNDYLLKLEVHNGVPLDAAVVLGDFGDYGYLTMQARHSLTWSIHLESTAVVVGNNAANAAASGTVGHLFGNAVNSGTGLIVGGPDILFGRHELCLDYSEGVDLAATPAEDVVAQGLQSLQNSSGDVLKEQLVEGTLEFLARHYVDVGGGVAKYVNPYLAGSSHASELKTLGSWQYSYAQEDLTIPNRDTRNSYYTFANNFPEYTTGAFQTTLTISDAPIGALKYPAGGGAAVDAFQVYPPDVSNDPWIFGLGNPQVGKSDVVIAALVPRLRRIALSVEFYGPAIASARYSVDGGSTVAIASSPFAVEVDPLAEDAFYDFLVEGLDGQGAVVDTAARRVYLPAFDFSLSADVFPLDGLMADPANQARRSYTRITGVGIDASRVKLSHTDYLGQAIVTDYDTFEELQEIRSDIARPNTPHYVDYGNYVSVAPGQSHTLQVQVYSAEGTVENTVDVTWFQRINAWMDGGYPAGIQGDEASVTELLDERIEFDLLWNNGSNEAGVGPADRFVYVITRYSSGFVPAQEYYNATTEEWQGAVPELADRSYVDGVINNDGHYAASIGFDAPVSGGMSHIDTYALYSDFDAGYGLYKSSGGSTALGDVVEQDTEAYRVGAALLPYVLPQDYEWDFSIAVSRGELDENLGVGGLFDVTLAAHEFGADILNPRIKSSDWTLNVDGEGWMTVVAGQSYTQEANGVMANGFAPNTTHAFQLRFEDAQTNETITKDFQFVSGPAAWVVSAVSQSGSIEVTVNVVGDI